MNSIQDIIDSPPVKFVKCSRCRGLGYINPRGMVSSDDCPVCDGAKRMRTPDLAKAEKAIRKLIAEEGRKLIAEAGKPNTTRSRRRSKNPKK